VRYGTRLDRSAGRLVRVADRDGAVHATFDWDGDAARVAIRLGGDAPDELVVDPAEDDPIFGRAHPVVVVRGGKRERRTSCTPIDWRAPRRIPAIAMPGQLPPGAGAPLLNLIALAAAEAGVTALRYAGPYPTAALWTALAACFRTTGDAAAFTAGAADRALRLARDEIPIDFAPAPFERAWIRGGEVHLRDGVERARIGGVVYRHGGSPARLVADGDAVAAEVWFGDAPWARVAVLDAAGRLVDGPRPVPACTNAVIGQRFPAALRAALAELIADVVAPPLADAARGVLADDDVRWADCGAAAARGRPDGIEVHAALWERLAPHGLPRLAAALAEALAPVVAARAQARLAAAIAHW
jgi:YD repeat-containing protein